MTGEKKKQKILAKSLKVPQFFFGVKMAIVFFGMRKLSFHVWKPSGEKKFGFNECFELINTLVPNILFFPTLSLFLSVSYMEKKNLQNVFSTWPHTCKLILSYWNFQLASQTQNIKCNHGKKKKSTLFSFFSGGNFRSEKTFFTWFKGNIFSSTPKSNLK